MAFIKSHSNYVLKSKHQTISDGTIWERDITTIGGLNQFSPGQVPIYRSNNFIISVRNDGKISNQFNKTKWLENSDGTIWTQENIDEMVLPFEEDNDVKIVLKQDYYDFNDFAYYGSLSELFRASITDILSRFPGELYMSSSNFNVYYNSSSSNEISSEIGDKPSDSYRAILGNGNEIKNPFGIDIHSIKKPLGANTLKYFADGGYENYEIIKGDGEEVEEIIGWTGITLDSGATFCPGDMLGTVYIASSSHTFSIEAWVGDYNKIYYLHRGSVQYRATTSSININADSCDSSGELDVDVEYSTDSDYEDYEEDIHIRPKEEFISKFYNECDNFEKIILNRKTTPKYKAIFSVIKENEFGYYREMQEFIFPTSEGRYNLNATEYGFNDYTKRLSQIGEFYDERFTDNLYRAMTHEAIKNFDWTFTREFYEGEGEEYVFGGEKIQKTLRLFAREFDEIKSYIDNISNFNRITYDERNNIPDYFLTDTLSDSGWDVKLVMPYGLKEVFLEDRTEVPDSGYTLDFQLNNSVYQLDDEDNPVNKLDQKYFTRQFFQISNKEIRPYSNEYLPEGIQNGYFIVICNDGNVNQNVVSCAYNETMYKILEASGYTYVDGEADVQYRATTSSGNINVGSCDTLGEINVNVEYSTDSDCECDSSNRRKFRIKSFTDERPYTYFEANKEFLRRLKINSPYILRHKGTIEGVEMILGMFGLKSKRWVEAQPELVKACKYTDEDGNLLFDYEIVEYSSFTNRIEEKWDASKGKYRADWLNSTKTITYNNRSQGLDEIGISSYISYQGLPVGYRDEYEYSQEFIDSDFFDSSGYTPYISIQNLTNDWTEKNEVTSSVTEAFKDIDKNNQPVKRRYLYPRFENYEQVDGNPYFQMDGGWLAKTIGSNNNIYNFQYDFDDNVVFTLKIPSGYANEDLTIVDDSPLFKETVRNIRMVNNIKELLNIPRGELYNGTIIYVAKIENNIATIGNSVYTVFYEYNSNASTGTTGSTDPLKYIKLYKSDDLISPSFGVYFDDNIIVYGKDRTEIEYSVFEIENGDFIKAYIFEDMSIPFMCKDDNGSYFINTFNMVVTEEDDTNYFLLENVDFSDTLLANGSESWAYGWRRLKDKECEYLKINTIENYYSGNNPHNGKMIYDSGHEYFTYFNRIFKYAHDNLLFDYRCYNDGYDPCMEEINSIGFNWLIDKNEIIKQYTPFLISGDTKIRYFGNYKTRNEDNTIKEIYIYGGNQEKLYNNKLMYGQDYSGYTDFVSGYTLADYFIPSNENEEEEMSVNVVIDLHTNPDFKIWNDYVDTDIIDESTNQIVNNKRLSIIFNLHNDWYTNEGQTEVKYLDSIILNYLTQMLPSSVIVDIQYKDNEVI